MRPSIRPLAPSLVAALLAASAALAPGSALAATPTVWTKSIESKPGSVVALTPGPSGGFFAAVRPGFYSSLRQGIRRFDASGRRLWARNFPAEASVWLGDLASDGTGVYLTFREAADDEDTHYAVRKYALDGRELWTTRWTGWQEDNDPDRQGYPPVTVAGGTVSVLYDPIYASEDPDYWQAPRAVARFDADDGDRLADWKVPVKRYPASNWSAEDIAATAAGVYTLTAYEDESDTGMTTQLQIDLLRSGGVVWTTRAGRHADDAWPVALTADAGGALVSYFVYDARNRDRPHVLRIRPDGSTAWLRKQPAYGAGPVIGDGATTWAVRHAYGSATSSDIVVRRLDGDGATIRERRYGDSHWESADWVIAVGRFLYLGGVIRGRTSTAHYPMIMKVRKP